MWRSWSRKNFYYCYVLRSHNPALYHVVYFRCRLVALWTFSGLAYGLGEEPKFRKS
ncbi:hypothetical protein KHA80_07800 [Anaerobacillus sp. HL2]|nr:hypothetical protein KHA80_07800 [Anaerobacillus sp. HL2]